MPKQKFIELIGKDRTLVSDSTRLRALLLDMTQNADRAYVNAIITAQEIGIATYIENSPVSQTIEMLTKKLHDEAGLREDIARYAVESWTLALKPDIVLPVSQTGQDNLKEASANHKESHSRQSKESQTPKNKTKNLETEAPKYENGKIAQESHQTAADAPDAENDSPALQQFPLHQDSIEREESLIPVMQPERPAFKMDWTIVIFISFIVPVSIITIIGLAGSLHFKKGSLIPVTKSEYLTDLGRRQFFEGNYGEAIDTCTAAIAIDGDNADAYRYRAYAYDGLKLYGSSIEDYTKAIELNPGDIFLYNDRGKARLRLNEKDSACEDFRKACDLENKDGCGLYDSNCK